MLLRDFASLLDVLESVFNESYVDSHRQIAGILNNLRTSPNPDLEKSLTDWTTKLEKLCDDYDVVAKELPWVARAAESLKIDQYFGGSEYEYVHYVVETGSYNASIRIEERISKLEAISRWVIEIQDGFKGFGVQSSSNVLLNGDNALVDFLAAGKAEVNDLESINKLTSNLGKHLHALARLVEESPKSPEVYAISKSSPMEVKILVANGLVYTVNKTLSLILDNVLKVQQIRKSELEIKKNKLEYKVLTDAFKATAKQVQDEAPKEIAKVLYDEFKPPETHGSRNEIEKGVEEAVKYLRDFINDGGHVDVALIKSEANSKQNAEARKLMLESRNLYKQLADIDSQLKKLAAGNEKSTL
jgi:hypothetical protein